MPVCIYDYVCMCVCIHTCTYNYVNIYIYIPMCVKRHFKGQMHHHNDLGSKCAYTCHLSNKTTRKSVLLSTPQIWQMKVSKKLA